VTFLSPQEFAQAYRNQQDTRNCIESAHHFADMPPHMRDRCDRQLQLKSG